MATEERFYPRTHDEVFEDMILKKRELVAAGDTDWTTEAPGDYGINIVNLVAYAIAQYEGLTDNRTKQAYAAGALAREAVMDGVRTLGHRYKGPLPSTIPISVVSSASTEIPQYTKLVKELEDGTDVVFETIATTVFSGAETKIIYAIQGELTTKRMVSTGAAFQKAYIPVINVASNYFGVYVEDDSTQWRQVADFSGSTSSSKHFMVEFDYLFRAILIFPDGIHGMRPPIGKAISIYYRACDGALGNVSPGIMRALSKISNITSYTNQSPISAVLASVAEITDTEITVVDDESISAFDLSGVAYIGEDGDSFIYDGISGTSFQNVSGLTRSHAAGEEVCYTTGQVFGEDPETLKEAKLAAFRGTRLKSSAGSLLDYGYVARKVPGVTRAGAFSVGHTQFVQVVPHYAGVPNTALLEATATYLEARKNSRHTIHVIPPRYVYVDITVEVTPVPGREWDSEIEPAVLQLLQYYLSPLSVTFDGAYYTSAWGRSLKKAEVIYLLMYRMGGSYLLNTTITEFKRSTALSGNLDVPLYGDEIANIGSLTIVNPEAVLPVGTIATTIGF